jgi:hypothetical protein
VGIWRLETGDWTALAKRSWRLAAALVLALGAIVPALVRPVPAARACAFVDPPLTYETTEDRRLYMQAMELAGFDMLFPKDRFFSQGSIGAGTRESRVSSADVYVPPTLLKAISWIESSSSQGAPDLPFGAIGPALVAFDCGYGISQVTSGMTVPLGENNQPTDEQALVATHFAYNIGRGAAILIDKWNAAPDARPIAGIDTNSDPHIVENWYFAVWSYNGFTGPGANRSNHPMDPVYAAWPRTPYSCGSANDGLGHDRSRYPYQELVYGCAAHPPLVKSVDAAAVAPGGEVQANAATPTRTAVATPNAGSRPTPVVKPVSAVASALTVPLWQPMDATLPDLNNPYWRSPLGLQNFQYPYDKMDIPTPKPQHSDPTARPSDLLRSLVLGSPKLAVDRPIVLVNVRPGQSASPADVTISNAGTGIIPWRITSNKSWIKVSNQAGVAVGNDLPCKPGAPCVRTATLKISVDPTKVLGSDAAVVHIQGLGPNAKSADIAVFIRVNVAVGVPGTTRN